MDIGMLILDEIVGPAEAFFSLRNIPSKDSAFPGKKKKIDFIQHYLHCIEKLFMLENHLH
jgi:hypothetical protein